MSFAIYATYVGLLAVQPKTIDFNLPYYVAGGANVSIAVAMGFLLILPFAYIVLYSFVTSFKKPDVILCILILSFLSVVVFYDANTDHKESFNGWAKRHYDVVLEDSLDVSKIKNGDLIRDVQGKRDIVAQINQEEHLTLYNFTTGVELPLAKNSSILISNPEQ